ncbi:MAG: GNAT family N-acetyltransferase [Pseudomonadota bacterium]
MFLKHALRIRDYHSNDLHAVVALFGAAVHTLAATHYDAAQRQAWAPEQADLPAWQARLAGLQTRVAEHNGRLAGFIAYTPEGHIDLLYCAPDHARQGVAGALYRAAQASLETAGVQRLFTKASLTARPFFERQDFRVEQLQRVFRGAVALQRFAMNKELQSAGAASKSAHE